MLKMFSFGTNARPETFVPLNQCVIDDTLSQATPDLRQIAYCSSSFTSWT